MQSLVALCISVVAANALPTASLPDDISRAVKSEIIKRECGSVVRSTLDGDDDELDFDMDHAFQIHTSMIHNGISYYTPGEEVMNFFKRREQILRNLFIDDY